MRRALIIIKDHPEIAKLVEDYNPKNMFSDERAFADKIVRDLQNKVEVSRKELWTKLYNHMIALGLEFSSDEEMEIVDGVLYAGENENSDMERMLRKMGVIP